MNGIAAGATMTPLQRVLTTLSHREPDRVPLFLLLTTHGARELKLSIHDYFHDAEAIAEGQVRMQRRYGHDCLYAFTYAAIETEAWGAEASFVDDGPPNAGAPIITAATDIDTLPVPVVADCSGLARNLRAISLMKQRVGDTVPIIGVVMAPFSLPVMQMGFSAYLDLLYEDRARFDRLMRINQQFCVAWANAQLQAGATAICYFDPVASTDIVPARLYSEIVYPLSCRTIAQINGPTATHFASGRCLSLIDAVVDTKTAVVGVSVQEDLTAVKRSCTGRITVLGNLDGVSMRRWTTDETEQTVRAAIADAAPGGGFVLSDNHGEIHFSVPEATLETIAESVRRWGRYPIQRHG